MGSSVNLTKRVRNRKLKSGAILSQTRWVLNYQEPRTSKRRQQFFKRQKDAQTERNQIIASIENGTYSEAHVRSVTIRNCVDRWLEARACQVKDGTLDGYRRAAANIVGPLLVASPQQRTKYKISGLKPVGAKTLSARGRQGLRTRDE